MKDFYYYELFLFRILYRFSCNLMEIYIFDSHEKIQHCYMLYIYPDLYRLQNMEHNFCLLR